MHLLIHEIIALDEKKPSIIFVCSMIRIQEEMLKGKDKARGNSGPAVVFV